MVAGHHPYCPGIIIPIMTVTHMAQRGHVISQSHTVSKRPSRSQDHPAGIFTPSLRVLCSARDSMFCPARSSAFPHQAHEPTLSIG